MFNVSSASAQFARGTGKFFSPNTQMWADNRQRLGVEIRHD